MEPQLPSEIRDCIRHGAERLGRALVALEWPNGGKDAAPAEINALLNVGYFLQALPEPYDIYAEGSCASGRIDAMGFNGRIAFALEAKKFGGINAQANSAYNDLDRMREFRPEMTQKLSDSALRPREWWSDASERWGIILISSFRGQEVAEAWAAEDENKFLAVMRTYTHESDRPATGPEGIPTGIHRLYQQFSHANRGAALVTDSTRWQDCGQGWFLWGAIPL